MRTKNKLGTFVALMLLVGAIMAGIAPVQAQPTLRLLPAPTITHDLGEKFNITLNIESIADLGAWTADIEWDPSILNYTGTHDLSPPVEVKDRMWEGPFVKGAGATNFLCTKAAPGNLTGLTVSLQSPGTGASGSGVLATFELEVVGYGSTGINVTYVALVEGDLTTVYTVYNVVDTDFTKSPPPPYGPTVDFSWPAGTYNENDNVTFTATSTAGYHINTGFLPVMNYTWDFGDGTSTVVDDVSGTPGADSVVTHNFTAAATRTVTVTAETEDNPADTLETASKSKDIIIWAIVYSYVDVVTVKTWLGNTTMSRARGEAADMPGSAFAPGETVTLVSEALYLGFPVVDLNVGFQVNKPDGSLFASISGAKSNASGQVRVSFRVPQAPLPAFGAYEVSSTARIFEEDFSDLLKFYVGWIVEIDSVICETDPVAIGATATFNVTVTHYDPYDAYPVVLTVNAFDSLAQASGSDSLAFDITAAGTGTPGTAGPSTTTTYLLYITIPGYVWPGTATVKANAYTDYPDLGGTAYCPEKIDYFSIIYIP